jgi:APA family basic amino acid/polyamine antiporter
MGLQRPMPNIRTRKSTAELLDEAAQGEESDGEVRALKRALGVGGIIGAGIFVLTGHAAAANAGPAEPPSSDSS